MKLPNQHLAQVPREKVADYLLSTNHRDGRHKAAFFNGFGFEAENWQLLAAALRQHVADHGVSKDEAAQFGRRYVVDGIMAMPDGRTAMLRSVSFVDFGEDVPRFVTAYPLRRLADD